MILFRIHGTHQTSMSAQAVKRTPEIRILLSCRIRLTQVLRSASGLPFWSLALFSALLPPLQCTSQRRGVHATRSKRIPPHSWEQRTPANVIISNMCGGVWQHTLHSCCARSGSADSQHGVKVGRSLWQIYAFCSLPLWQSSQ